MTTRNPMSILHEALYFISDPDRRSVDDRETLIRHMLKQFALLGHDSLPVSGYRTWVFIIFMVSVRFLHKVPLS